MKNKHILNGEDTEKNQHVHSAKKTIGQPKRVKSLLIFLHLSSKTLYKKGTSLAAITKRSHY